MENNDIFKKIQEYVSDVPLILFGTGGTMPYGIPGMGKLSEFLIKNLNDKYDDDEGWSKFIRNIRAGKDLESALTDITLDRNILNDIIVKTWELVNEYDLKFFYEKILNNIIVPIAQLINRFYEPTPQCVNIITTNYDRIIEYACDQMLIPIDKRFDGYYYKNVSTSEMKKKKVVNLIKVHGSLDLFKDINGRVHSIPLQKEIPKGLVPEIVTPGENKYKSILVGEYRDLIHIADDLISNAKSFLCIGYGFNDEQIQRNIIGKINIGNPIVVVTKELSEKSRQLIVRNSTKYIIIEQCKSDPSKTAFYINKEEYLIEGEYWSVDKFLEII